LKEAPLVRNPELGSSADGELSHSGGRNTPTPFDNKPPRHNSYWKQFWKWAGLFLFLAISSAFAYFNLTHSGKEWKTTAMEYAGPVIESKLNPGLIFDHAGSDVVNILLIGRDVNWTVKKVYDPSRKIWANMQVHDEDTPARSDTMLIISLDRNRNVVHMVSLPRDARIRMPENKYGVRRAKLNAAHAYGGPDMLVKTIHDELGITIHHYAVIRFEGFMKLIDQVGGIEVNVIGALHRDGSRGRLKYDDNWGNLHIDLMPGKQVLDGEKAHAYVRFRMDIEGDPGRIKRQQQVMRALAKKLTTQGIGNLPALIKEIRKQFLTDPHFDISEMASAADFAKGVGDASKIQPVTLFGTYTERGSIILNESKNRKLLHYIFGPTFNDQNFLKRSPSTEGDEMGEENNSSPGAKEILIRAGIIKGAIPAEPQTAEYSTPPTSEERPRRAERHDEGLSTDTPSEALSTPSETPRRERRERRVRRQRTESTSSSSSREHIDLSTPGGTDLAVPSDESRGSDYQSPVPVPEGLSTPDNSDSPIPRAE
jgi:LCP family protein required for cell wall assembly